MMNRKTIVAIFKLVLIVVAIGVTDLIWKELFPSQEGIGFGSPSNNNNNYNYNSGSSVSFSKAPTLNYHSGFSENESYSSSSEIFNNQSTFANRISISSSEEPSAPSASVSMPEPSNTLQSNSISSVPVSPISLSASISAKSKHEAPKQKNPFGQTIASQSSGIGALRNPGSDSPLAPPPPPDPTPLDGGTWVLIVVGIALGLFFTNKKRNITLIQN